MAVVGGGWVASEMYVSPNLLFIRNSMFSAASILPLFFLHSGDRRRAETKTLVNYFFSRETP